MQTTTAPDRRSAHSRPNPAVEAAAETFVTFDLAGQTFGVDVGHVREILDRMPVSRLPNARADCTGVIDTRGEAIPLIDLSGQLGLGPSETGTDTRIIVFEVPLDGRNVPVGVLAERVLDVCRIEGSAIEPAPPAATGGADATVRGLARLGETLIVLIDVVRLLGAGEARP